MSPATTTNDVHIGDVGTEFVGEVQDRGVAFNPTGATKSQLLFKTPAGILLTRDANITTTGAGAPFLVIFFGQCAGGSFAAAAITSARITRATLK